MKTTHTPGFSHAGGLRQLAAATILAAGGMASTGALAAGPGSVDRAEIDATWRSDRAACLDGSSAQERRACLAEAAAVRKEALAGQLGMVEVAGEALLPGEDDLLAHALSRCDAVPQDVRGDCERRVIGGDAVIVVGSVAQGGILRELRPEPDLMLAQAAPASSSAAEVGAAAQDTLEYEAEAADFDEAAETAEAEGFSYSLGGSLDSAELAPADDAGIGAGAPDARPEVIIVEPIEPPMEAPPADGMPVEDEDDAAWRELDEPAAPDAGTAGSAYPAWMRPARFVW